MLACAEGTSKIVKMLLTHKDIDPNVQCMVSVPSSFIRLISTLK